MTDEGMSNPLDLLHPHEEDINLAQQAWLAERLGSGARVLDLGCGGGRTLVPLAQQGVICTGIDHDSAGLDLCRQSLAAAGVGAELVEADFQQWLATTKDTWDVICCLGNTLCQIWEVDQAISLMSQVQARLAPGGCFVVDDIPADLWPEVAAGYWQEGLDPETGRQLVWADDDLVFTLRSPERSDPDNWDLVSDDVRFRLWTAGSLQLAAHAAGFEVPFVPDRSCVRVLTPRN